MRYAGWNFEKTLLVRETANIPRTGELVDVRLAVETDRAGNLANDVRVILKKDWNVLDREIPCQVHRIERHGPTTTFRVAFHLDLPAGGQQRIGVYYDNPNAGAAEYQTSLEVQGQDLRLTTLPASVNARIPGRHPCGMSSQVQARTGHHHPEAVVVVAVVRVVVVPVRGAAVLRIVVTRAAAEHAGSSALSLLADKHPGAQFCTDQGLRPWTRGSVKSKRPKSKG